MTALTRLSRLGRPTSILRAGAALSFVTVLGTVTAARAVAQQGSVPTPESVLGFPVGADFLGRPLAQLRAVDDISFALEPGETLEQCVAREVFEEVGIEVKNLRARLVRHKDGRLNVDDLAGAPGKPAPQEKGGGAPVAVDTVP